VNWAKYILSIESLINFQNKVLTPIKHFKKIGGKILSKIKHGMILMTDITNYGRKKFSDIYRAKITTEFHNNLLKLFQDLSINLDECVHQDRGDGILYVFSPITEKRLIVTNFLPKLRLKILEMNKDLTTSLKIKIRAVVSFGECIISKSKLTKISITSTEINRVSYLLDSSFIKSWSQERSFSNPICVLFMDKFYSEIIKEQIPSQMNKFSRIQVETKKKKEIVWAYDYQEVIKKEKLFKNIKLKKCKKVYLSELDGRCIYLSTADYYNYHLYKRMYEKVPLKNHLETALLLSDFVILHCADPYRLELVLDLCYEYEDFIKNGELVFLLARDIDNMKKDFKKYLNRKSNQYLSSSVSTLWG